MKFLKEQSAEEEPLGEDDNAITVKRVIKVTVQCGAGDCDFWGKMEGGLIDEGKAAFVCPKCGEVNHMKWLVDG